MTKSKPRELSPSNSPYEKDLFNEVQNFLYKRAIFGIKVYTDEQINKMNHDKKRRIIKVHKRCQNILNIWKQELCNDFTNRIFEKLFPRPEMSKFFYVTHRNSTDADYMNTLNFKDMGVSKKQIVDKLIIEGVLPKDFYNLKKNED